MAAYSAAALRGVDLFRTAWPIQIVRIVDRIDHAHCAERAAPDEGTQLLDRRIEGMAVANDQVDAGRARRVDDRRAVVKR